MRKKSGTIPTTKKKDLTDRCKFNRLHLTDKEIAKDESSILETIQDSPENKINIQIDEKIKYTANLISINKELILSNRALSVQNDEKIKCTAKLIIENSELLNTNKKLLFQNEEHGKKSDKLSSLISNLNKAEQKTIKANRLYAVISHTNKTITHVNNEMNLFSEVCKIVVKYGKFKMAWIGIADTKNTKIKLVASFGATAGDKKILANKTYDFNGPTKNILNGSAYYAVNNTQISKSISWGKYAKKRGFNSFISLPIKKSGVTIGTFDIYSDEINFFDTQEINMLEEVTADISFGLALFEKSKIHLETEKLILQKEKHFRALIEKSSDMITLSTSEGKMIYISPSITKVLGYTLKDVNSIAAVNFVHPDDVAKYSSERIELLKTPGKSFSSQHRLKHKNGDWIWCAVTLTNLLNEPTVSAIVTNFRDISEKKKMEQQQIIDKYNLDALINNTSDLMWSVDCNYKIITFNQPLFKIVKLHTGIELKNGYDIRQVVLNQEQSKRFRSHYEKAFKGASFTEIELFKSPEKTWYDISFCPIRQGNNIIGAACHSRDISERMKFKLHLKELNENLQIQTNELKESESRYSNIFNLSPQAKWVYEPETYKFIQVNNAAILLYGYSKEEFKKMSILDIKMNDDIIKEYAEINTSVNENRIYNNTFRHKKKSGEIIEVEIYSTPILINGKSYISEIAIDVTQKNKQVLLIEKAIIKTQEEERYEIGGELHDNVCQLLATSKMSLGMLKPTLTSKTKINYNQCLEQINLALTELRNISHRLAPVFLADETLYEIFSNLLNSVNVNEKFIIQTHFDEVVKKLRLNPDLQLNLYRILQQQLRNILSYSNATIIDVKIINNHNKLVMSISDNGDGFDTAKLHTGIGFANMKRRVKLFSGEFNIVSSPGNGCKIIIEIPLHILKEAIDKKQLSFIFQPASKRKNKKTT